MTIHKGASGLEQALRGLAAEGTVEALEHHLPGLLERIVLPPDSNHRHSLKEAAARLRIPEDTLRRRIKAGEVKVVRDGKYAFILEEDLVKYNRMLRDREQFRRDQETPMPIKASPEIAALLEPKKKRAAKR